MAQQNTEYFLRCMIRRGYSIKPSIELNMDGIFTHQAHNITRIYFQADRMKTEVTSVIGFTNLLRINQ